MLTGLESIVVEVDDLAAAIRDFGQLLGRAPAARRSTGAGRDAAAGDDPAAGDGGDVTFALANVRLDLRETMGSAARSARGDGGGIAAIRLRLAPGAEARGRAVGAIASPTVPIALVSAASASERLAPTGFDVAEREPAGRITGLDHIVIVSADPERTGRFLGESLGIRLALDRCLPERGLRLMFFRLGGVTLEVASALAEAPPSPAVDAFHGLAWRVAGLDRLHARLVGAGFRLSPIRPGHKPGTRVCTVLAPVHGVPTLLIEPLAPPAGEA
ncbi:MAG: VOC family protein [Myxococcota bacterium]